ncbi:hypothetical protein, partial [Streptomyces noursei]
MALGRVEVDVVANTARFESQIRRAAESADDARIKVEAAGIQQAREQIRRAAANQVATIRVRVTKKSVRDALNAATAGQTVRVTVEPMVRGFRTKMEAELKRYNFDDIKIRIVPNWQLWYWKLRLQELKAAVEPLSIRVVPQTRGFITQLRNGVRTSNPVTVPVAPQLARGGGGIDRLLATRTGPFGNFVISGLFGDLGHIIHSWGQLDHAVRMVSRSFRELVGFGPPISRSLSQAARGVSTGLRGIRAGFSQML